MLFTKLNDLLNSWRWSRSVVSNSLRPHGLYPTRLLRPWDSPGKSTRVGCHSLLQGIFLTQESNLGLLHYRQILYHLSYRETQIVRTHIKETTRIQDPASSNHQYHPVQDASSKQQKYKPNHQQTGLPRHSVLTIRGKTNKNSAQISPYTKLTQTTGPDLGGQKWKGRNNSTLKPGKMRPQTQ